MCGMNAANATIGQIYGGALADGYEFAQSGCVHSRPGVAEESRPFSGDTPDVPGKLDPCRASVRNATRHLARK
jgi:hypothetical protein